MFAM